MRNNCQENNCKRIQKFDNTFNNSSNISFKHKFKMKEKIMKIIHIKYNKITMKKYFILYSFCKHI